VVGRDVAYRLVRTCRQIRSSATVQAVLGCGAHRPVADRGQALLRTARVTGRGALATGAAMAKTVRGGTAPRPRPNMQEAEFLYETRLFLSPSASSPLKHALNHTMA